TVSATLSLHDALPISSENPAGDRERGDWGGIVLNGRSICNFPADECVGEGSSGQYGGDQLDDNSGRIVYTRIEFAGYEVSFGNRSEEHTSELQSRENL